MITKVISHRKFTYKVIQWELLNYCNYNCYYCGLHNNSEICTNYKDVVAYLNNNIPNSIFPTIPQLFGGEPTLHPNFWEIVDSLQVPFGIYTNLSKPLSFFQQLIKHQNLHHIYCSLHPLSIKSIEEFQEKLDFLKKNNVNLTLNIMLESNDSILYDIYNKYKDSLICIMTKIPNFNSNIIIDSKYIHARQYFDIVENDKVQTFSSFQYDDIQEVQCKNFVCTTINYFNNIDIEGNITNYCRKFKITDIYENRYNKINVNKILCKAQTCPKYCNVIGQKFKI